MHEDPAGPPAGSRDGVRAGSAATRPSIRHRLGRWLTGAADPVPWTAAAVVVGFVGVMASERAATFAPVALPLLLATGILGALVRSGWGGPGWTWVGGASAEAFGAFAYLATRPSADAEWDALVPLLLAAGVALFAGIFFAAFVFVAGARWLFPRRIADMVAGAAIVVLVGFAVAIAASTPSETPGGTPGPTAPPGASSRILRA